MKGLFAVETKRAHHRDVRQAEQAGVVPRLIVDMFMPGPGPVSYTHLDVYKRQVQGWRVDMGAVGVQHELIVDMHG